MRIVGGKYRGKKLNAPSGMATRPTTDRVRENLFNILTNHRSLESLRVLDLFAGTGALGLEALSRGAGFCVFVDNAGSARAAIRTNIEALGLSGQTKVYRRDASRLGDVDGLKPFDLVFADPPYGKALGEAAAKTLRTGGWLAGNAIFILEENRSSIPDLIDGFATLDKRNYGESAIGLFEYQG